MKNTLFPNLKYHIEINSADMSLFYNTLFQIKTISNSNCFTNNCLTLSFVIFMSLYRLKTKRTELCIH